MKRLLNKRKKYTSELLKTKQYFVSVLIDIVIIGIITGIKWKWGNILLGKDEVTLGFIMHCVRNLVLVFAAINLISTLQHLYIWNSNGRKHTGDDTESLLTDWKSGELSPVKVSLAFIIAGTFILACIMTMWL